MINYEIFCQIWQLKEHKQLTAAQIAAELSLDVRTVAKRLDRNHFALRKKTRRAGKPDPFKNDIVRMLDDHPYTATQIFQRIRSLSCLSLATINRAMTVRREIPTQPFPLS